MGNCINRRGKKNRQSERDNVEVLLRSFIKKPPKTSNARLITKEDLDKADGEFIHDIANVQVFLRWMALGGMMQGISLLEAATLPTTLLSDMVYLSGRYGTLKKEQAEREKLSAGKV